MLSVRWLTLDIMKEFIKDFLSHTVLSILGKSSDWAVVEDEDGHTGIPSMTTLADSILRGRNMKLERRSCQNPRYRTLCVSPSSGWISVEEWKPRPSDGEAMLDILEIGYTRNAIAHRFGMLKERLREESWMVPNFEVECQVPPRLLHGPWTDEKSDFLMFLMRPGLMGTCHHEKFSDLEVADLGLIDAIREGNMRVVKTLVSVISLEENSLEGVTDDTEKDYSQPRDPETNHVIVSQGNRRLRRLLKNRRRYVGVVPQTHHLRVAVLEKHCAKHIVSWLFIAERSKIDWNDEQVMNWAARKEAEGERIGSWLLGLRNTDIFEDTAHLVLENEGAVVEE